MQAKDVDSVSLQRWVSATDLCTRASTIVAKFIHGNNGRILYLMSSIENPPSPVVIFANN